MQPFDYAKLVDVPAATLAAFQAQATAAAGTVGHADLADALTKLAAATLPVDNRYLGQVRWVREWSRRNAVAYGALGTAAQAVLDQATGFPWLVREDAGTVAHVWFDGAQLRDSKGNAWVMNGSVPQVDVAGGAPPGAGPFSAANYYSIATNVLSFAGDFSGCIVGVRTSGDAGNESLVHAGTASADGWLIVNSPNGGNGAILVGFAASVQTNLVDMGHGWQNGVLTVTCFGRSGTTGYVKSNLAPLTTGSVGTVSAGGAAARIGFRLTGIEPAIKTTLYEAWFSTTTPSDALFTQIMNDVKRQLGITAW